MTENITNRDVQVLDLPVHDISLLKPENIVLHANNTHIDVGRLCFTKTFSKENVNYKDLVIDKSSVSNKRIVNVRKLIDGLSDAYNTKLYSADSIYTYVFYYNKFIDWANNSSLLGALESFDLTKDAFSKYIEYMKMRVRKGELTNNSVSSHLKSIVRVSEIIFDDDIDKGLILPKVKASNTKSRKAPSDDSQMIVLAISLSLFDSLYEHVINDAAFPVKIAVPKIIDERGYFFMLPTEKGYMATSHNAHKVREAYNSKTAEIKNYSEFNGCSNKRYLNIVSPAIKQLQDANLPRSLKRLRSAYIACQIFMILFSAATGMNYSQIRMLGFSKKYKVSAETQGFREIKYRANNKVVHYSIAGNFLKYFKNYVELRDYILNGKSWGYLFCSFGKGHSSYEGEPNILNKSSYENAYTKLKLIYPDIPVIRTSFWRVAKSEYLLTNTDIATAALLLQNSEQTLLKSYSNGSESKAHKELGSFYTHIKTAINNSKKNGEVEISLGGCKSLNDPDIKDSPLGDSADCSQPEGCLFCDNFIVHADEKDIRKLASYKYIVNLTSHLSNDSDHFRSIFGEIFNRVEFIFNEVRNKSDSCNEMVNNIIDSVEEDGCLDQYWQGKFDMLVELGQV